MQRPGADALIALALALASFLLYVPTFSNGRVDYDDPDYIGQPMVLRGLSGEGVRWALGATATANWLPLTWLSHMLDVQVYGTKWGGHHATSAALHAANAALAFVVLRRMTRAAPGSRWQSAAAAAFFAFHPLRVESVAWIAERKDVLAATFGLLSLLAYAGYCRRPSALRYASVMAAYALGLMAKPMLVTLPFVMLLLDYWPLGRVRWPRPAGAPGAAAPTGPRQFGIGRLVLEKLPLLALAAADSVATMNIQRGHGATLSAGHLTSGQRLANAAVSVARYIGKTLRPVDLSVFYPHPRSWPAWQVAASVALIVVVTAVAVALARRRPYLLVGWLWFLGMLVPVVGIVQVGMQSMADRYSYLPSIGLLVATVWGAGDVVRRLPSLQMPVAAVAGTLLAVLAGLTWLQEGYWASTYDLFSHALDVDADNFLAHDMVGLVYAQAGDDAKAIEHYRRAIALNGDYPNAHHNYAVTLDRLGRTEEAIEQYRQALRVRPDLAVSHFRLAEDLANQKDFADADHEFAAAARLAPGNPGVQAEWGRVLLDQGRAAEAAARFAAALRLDPDHPAAREGLAKTAAQPATRP